MTVFKLRDSSFMNHPDMLTSSYIHLVASACFEASPCKLSGLHGFTAAVYMKRRKIYELYQNMSYSSALVAIATII